MTRVVVTGYAGLDHVVILEGRPAAGTTTRILARPEDAWPRLGGGPAYVCMAMVRRGLAEAIPVSWVGADANGVAWRTGLAARGVPCHGIAAIDGARTPVTVIAYEPDGGCICLYDAGMPDPELSAAQAGLLAGAEWVCVTIGPPAVTGAVLDRIAQTTRLVWVVKRDTRGFARGQSARLARRADLICYSRAEADFAEAACAEAGGARPGSVRVETRGAAGAVLIGSAGRIALPAQQLAVSDPTGAGDTLVGGMIAALVAVPEDPVAALRAGIGAAAEMLRVRARGAP